MGAPGHCVTEAGRYGAMSACASSIPTQASIAPAASSAVCGSGVLGTQPTVHLVPPAPLEPCSTGRRVRPQIVASAREATTTTQFARVP